MITVVSGLPRSGTSLMMRMLQAGGRPALTDGERRADPDNPRGYFEFERVKGLPADTGWLDDAEGKAVKVISELLPALPADRAYQVVFMRRRPSEILASQATMIGRRGAAPGADDATLKRLYLAHLDAVFELLETAAHFTPLYVSYNRLVVDPGGQAARVAQALGGLDAAAMAAQIEPDLYRQRG